MNALRRGIDHTLRALIALLMAGMALNVTWQVFTRFVLKTPSSMTEEIARYSMIWLALLGAAYCVGKKSHLALDLLAMRLQSRARARRNLEIFIELAVLLFSLVILVGGGGRLVWISLQLGQVSAAMQIKLGYIYLALPVSGVLMAIYTVITLAETLRGDTSVSTAPKTDLT